MKKVLLTIIAIALVCCLALPVFTGCTGKDDGKMDIVVTIFPVYDWVMNVLGDRASDVNVKLLLDSGVDLHSYQPSVADMVAVAEADLFIYVGGESDEWVSDALKNKANKEMRTMDLLSLLGDKAQYEEIVEGMEHEHHHDHEDEDHDHDEDEDHDHDHEEEEEEGEYDEHVWLSLKNAAYYVGLIEKELSAIDPENAETYAANATQYVASLNALDAEYTGVVTTSPRDTILFGDRFPFRYLVEDYDLNYYAAFVGCSAETNASTKTMTFLTNKVNELGLKVILKLENSNGNIAEGIKRDSAAKNQEILVMDSLQSATKKEYSNGRNYLSVMESNLAVLRRALAA